MILNPDCSYLICPNKKFFSRLENLEGGVVYKDNDIYMGNDISFKAIGEVWLQKHDRTIRSLIDIWYVLDIKNIILLGVLIGNTLHITSRGSGLKATKGALIEMKAIWKNNLFYL